MSKRIKTNYKQYLSFGTSSTVPSRTKIFWARKKKTKRDILTIHNVQENISQHNEVESDQPDSTNGRVSSIHKSQGVTISDEGKPDQLNGPSIRELKNITTSKEVTSDQSDAGDETSILQEFDNTLIGPDRQHFNSRQYTESESDKEVSDESDTEDSRIQNVFSLKSQYSTKVLIQTLLVMATKIRHNLTYSATEDTLHLANVLGDLGVTHNSKYYFKKILDNFADYMSVHHFCDKCNHHVGQESGNTSNNEQFLHCPHCNNMVNIAENGEHGNIMLYLNLTDQLQYFLELHHDKLSYPETRQKQNAYALEDIFDGKMYKKSITPDTITINFNVDGTPLFKSSTVSVYPVLCSLNELPPRDRGKYIMISSLWFGKGKPKCMNEFLKPFVTEMKTLQTSGFRYKYGGNVYTKKCRMLVGICDSVAAPVVRNGTQYNGEYGCGLCLHPGVQVPKGRGTVRVYPIDELGNPFGEGLRNHNQTLLHAANREKGMKDTSILCDATGFNIISQLIADWMHLATLGLAKQFCKLWFDSQYHDELWYLGRYETTVNAMLESFTPTLDISRVPRKITERQFFKAHEWAIWLLFYSLPILRELAGQKFVRHWALLVDGISILLKTSIMPSEVEYAKYCLHEFVKGVENLYGIEHVSFNVHLLLHLPDSVLNWGPLWTHSAFIYESFNHDLKSAVHSSNGVSLQVCDHFRYKCAVNRLQGLYEEDMKYSEKKYLSKMLNQKILPRPSLFMNDIGLLGKVETSVTLSRDYYLALRRLDVCLDNFTTVHLVRRILMNKEVIHCKNYTRPKKRKSYNVLLGNGEIFEIEIFLFISADNLKKCYAIGKYYEIMNKTLFSDRRLVYMTFLKDLLPDLAAVDVHNIQQKVTLICTENSLIACALPNQFELWT